MANDFLHNNHLFGSRPFYGENSTTTLAEQRVALFYHLLDILWIEVAPTNDDQILEPTCDKKLPPNTKTQIPCTQKWPQRCDRRARTGVSCIRKGMTGKRNPCPY